jgi:hypothetical protein
VPRCSILSLAGALLYDRAQAAAGRRPQAIKGGGEESSQPADLGLAVSYKIRYDLMN